MKPYESGDEVSVLVHGADHEWSWMAGRVVSCEQPKGIREGRWVCQVAIGWSIHSAYMSRVYCGSDGVGDEVRPARKEVMSA